MGTYTRDDMADFLRVLATSIEDSADRLEARDPGAIAQLPESLGDLFDATEQLWLAGYVDGLRAAAHGLRLSAGLTAVIDELGERLG